jgi:hypothetical protein
LHRTPTKFAIRDDAIGGASSEPEWHYARYPGISKNVVDPLDSSPAFVAAASAWRAGKTFHDGHLMGAWRI